MKRTSFELLFGAARSVSVGAAFLFGLGFTASTAAQEEPVAEETITEETVETIQVDTPKEAPAEDVAPASQNATELDAIEVTGSRIKRTDYETAQPVVLIRREDIERTGLTNIGDILQRIPAAGSALNRTFNNGGNGQTEIDLRNLGSNRLLVLVDGHRWVTGTSFANLSAVDLNTIPVSAIERVEVLKDGASAVYGSDAITGVVNIILRKDFSGAEMSSQAQSFADGSGLVQAHHLSFGNLSDKSSMFIDFNFVRQEELFAAERDISKVPKFGTGTSRGSIFTPKGTLIFIPTPSNGSTLGPELCPDIVAGRTLAGEGVRLPINTGPAGLQLCQMILRDGQTITTSDTTATARNKYRFFSGLAGLGGNGEDPDKYNYAPINYLLTPFEQNSVFAQFNRQFADWLSFNNQVLYNVSKTERNLAETPLLLGNIFFPPYNQAYIDATNIYNPFDQDIGRSAPDGLVGFGTLGRRFVELGPRFLGRDVKTLFIKSQFDGSFDFVQRLFSYDLGYSFGRSDNSNIHRGDLDMERVKKALGPSINCPSTSDPGCVPLNLFGGAGTITPEMLNYIAYKATSSARYTIQDVYGNISTEFNALSGLLPFDILSAPIGVAFGAEYRQEDFTEQPDPFTVQGTSSTNLRKPTEGAYNVREAYVEFAVPIVNDKPFVQELDLSLAGRYTKYNTFKDKVTGKLGLRWKPIDDLLVRGTVSEAFRAPNISELFLGNTDSYPSLDDPCVGRTSGSAVDENCDEEGVPDDVSQLSSQILTRFQGNPKLGPETALTYTAGIVYSPNFLPDFNAYVDVFSIDLDEFIGFVGPDYILNTCYNRPRDVPRPQTCDLVNRNPSNGSIQFISARPINFARLKTEGVDIAFDYVLPVADWLPAMREFGSWKFMYDSQYLTSYDQFVPNAAGTDERSGSAGLDPGNNPLPRYKANATLEWALSNWKASWTTRYIRGTTESCSDGLSPALQTYGVCSNPDREFLDPALTDDVDNSTNEYKDIFYHNVQIFYALPAWNTDFTLGVNNVLNQDPPLSYSAFANSFPATLYEAPGSRQPYLKLNIRF